MNKAPILALCISISGCVSNAADTATPAPTDLTGIYKAQIVGGSIAWKINPDGTGVACEERTSMTMPTKVRNLVVNGDVVYDVFEFIVTDRTEAGISVKGITNLNFKKINAMPASCKL